jgi:hypothetical protein
MTKTGDSPDPGIGRDLAQNGFNSRNLSPKIPGARLPSKQKMVFRIVVSVKNSLEQSPFMIWEDGPTIPFVGPFCKHDKPTLAIGNTLGLIENKNFPATQKVVLHLFSKHALHSLPWRVGSGSYRDIDSDLVLHNGSLACR